MNSERLDHSLPPVPPTGPVFEECDCSDARGADAVIKKVAIEDITEVKVPGTIIREIGGVVFSSSVN